MTMEIADHNPQENPARRGGGGGGGGGPPGGGDGPGDGNGWGAPDDVPSSNDGDGGDGGGSDGGDGGGFGKLLRAKKKPRTRAAEDVLLMKQWLQTSLKNSCIFGTDTMRRDTFLPSIIAGNEGGGDHPFSQ